MHIFKLFRLVEFSKNFTIDDTVVFHKGDMRLAVNFAVVEPQSGRSWEIVSQTFPQSDLTFDVGLFRDNGYLSGRSTLETDVEKIRNYQGFDRALQTVYEKMYTRELVMQTEIDEKRAELTRLEQVLNELKLSREIIWGSIKDVT